MSSDVDGPVARDDDPRFVSPSRRTFLRRASAAVALASIAGCGSQPKPGTGTTEPTTRRPSRATAEYAVEVALDRDAYRLGGWRLDPYFGRGLPLVHAKAVPSHDDGVREAVMTAISTGQYTTTEPSTALLTWVDGVDLVVHGDEYYSLSHTFTEYVLNLDMGVEPAAVSEDELFHITDAEEAPPSVSEAVHTITPFGTEHGSEEFRTLVLTAELESFLDRYTYVRSDHGTGRVEFSVERQFSPYTLTARPATDEELYGRPVLEASSLSERSRRLVRESIDTHRRTPLTLDSYHRIGTLHTDSVPRHMEMEFRDVPYVRLDGTVYVFDVDHVHWDRQPFEFAVRTLDDGIGPDDPSELELSATNTDANPAVLSVPGLLPFGILWAAREGSDDRAVQLWSPRYASAETVATEGGVARPASYRHELTVRPGETVARTYQFGRDVEAISTGRYTVWGYLSVRWPTELGPGRHGGNSAVCPYDLAIDVSNR